jgi:hypothetical protein
MGMVERGGRDVLETPNDSRDSLPMVARTCQCNDNQKGTGSVR